MNLQEVPECKAFVTLLVSDRRTEYKEELQPSTGHKSPCECISDCYKKTGTLSCHHKPNGKGVHTPMSDISKAEDCALEPLGTSL